MIVLRSTIACDRRTIGVSSVTHNLNDVPGWLAGNSISMSKWNMDITHSNGTVVSLTNLSYPIEVHQDIGYDVDLNTIKIYRRIGSETLYFEITPLSAYGSRFDIFIEFREKSE